MTESEQLPPAPESRVDAPRDCLAQRAFDETVVGIRARLSFIEHVPEWKIETDADKFFRRIASEELKYVLSLAEKNAFWYGLPNTKVRNAGPDAPADTTNPSPAFSPPPCSAADNAGEL